MLKKLIDLIVRPHDGVVNPERRRATRVLSGLLFMVCVFIGLIFFQYLLDPTLPDRDAVLGLVAGCWLGYLTSYLLSRTPYAVAGGLLFCFILAAGVSLSILGLKDANHVGVAIGYLLLPAVIGLFTLPTRWGTLALSTCFVLTWTLPMLGPHGFGDGVVNLLVLFSGVYVLLYGGSYLRNQEALEIQANRSRMEASAKLAGLGEMSAGIAHEIRNPLAVISGAAQVMERQAKRGELDGERMLGLVERVRRNTTRIDKIIVALRNYARDGGSDDRESFTMAELFEDIQELVGTRASKFDIQVTWPEMEHLSDLQIEGKRIELVQVWVNLLSNAFDAIKDLPEKWVRVEVEPMDETILWRVVDSGSGIPKAIHSKLFLPFFTTKAPGSGTGLGLSLIQRIVQDHGGSIWLDQDASHTTFAASLPRSSVEKKEAA